MGVRMVRAVLVRESRRSSRPRNLSACSTPNRKAILHSSSGLAAKRPSEFSGSGWESQPSLTCSIASAHRAGVWRETARSERAAKRSLFVAKSVVGSMKEVRTSVSRGNAPAWDKHPVMGKPVINCVTHFLPLIWANPIKWGNIAMWISPVAGIIDVGVERYSSSVICWHSAAIFRTQSRWVER